MKNNKRSIVLGENERFKILYPHPFENGNVGFSLTIKGNIPVTINNCVVVVNGKNGDFISLPQRSYKGKDDETKYAPIAYFNVKEYAEEIINLVDEALEN